MISHIQSCSWTFGHRKIKTGRTHTWKKLRVHLVLTAGGQRRILSLMFPQI